MWHAVYWVDKFNLPSAQRHDVDSHPEKYLNVWKNPATRTFDEGRKRGGKQRWGKENLYSSKRQHEPLLSGYDIGLSKQMHREHQRPSYRRGAQDYEYLWLLNKVRREKANRSRAREDLLSPIPLSVWTNRSGRLATGPGQKT